MEIEAIKKTQTRKILEKENLGKGAGTTDSSIKEKELHTNLPHQH